MQNLKCLIFIILICNACSKDDKDTNSLELTGKWKLIEQLADPGDGSGVFMPVSSNLTIEFFNNETWESNGSLCTMTINSNQGSSGTYSLTDSTITVENCNSNQLTIYYELKDSYLILNYPCIEPCKQKFTKVE